MIDIKVLLTKILGSLAIKKTGNHLVLAGIHVCWGTSTITPTANTYTEIVETVPYSYTGTPICFASSANRAARIRTVYATQGDQTANKIRVGVYSTSGTQNAYVSWLTIGT